MTDSDGHPDIRVGFHELRSLLKAIFANNHTSLEWADILAEHSAGCERDDALSHGILRVPGYVDSLRSGWVDGLAVPDVDRAGPSFIRINARNGLRSGRSPLQTP